jgi:ornithine--oxo-acid transaminase
MLNFIKIQYKMFALGTNSRSLPLIIKEAKGSWLWDINGTRYIDAFSSFSSVNFGHKNQFLKQAMLHQMDRVSVFSRTMPSTVLLDLCKYIHNRYHSKIVSNHLKFIPMNSGVESGETAVKIARKWGYIHKEIPINQAKVVFASNNYWGKSISAISVSDYPYQKYFYPKTGGFLTVPYNDIEALTSLVESTPEITAVFLEPIQGEGGIIIPDTNYFKKVRELCTKHNILLICDEIQTGMGRTGSDLCIDHYGIKADMILLGKSLGGGFLPVSGCIVRQDVADVLNPGEHSSTFGGYPLGCKMALSSLQYLHHTDIISHTAKREQIFHKALTHLKDKYPHLIQDVRGKGMLWAIQFKPNVDAWFIVNQLTKFSIVTREANHNVVRLCPPLTILDVELTFLFESLDACLASLK